MLYSQEIEDLLCLVASLDRPALIHQFKTCQAPFPLDFTDDFLSSTPLERLKHIFVAIWMQSHQNSRTPTSHAA
ncbi:MAG TPA: hypothetical protein VG722_04305 [Tepidisphaeraceae bacterium]|nr:hypothetical protein [Tepidisphaeraceae bacterium]